MWHHKSTCKYAYEIDYRILKVTKLGYYSKQIYLMAYINKVYIAVARYFCPYYTLKLPTDSLTYFAQLSTLPLRELIANSQHCLES